jgi:choline-glycine betaine transporter
MKTKFSLITTIIIIIMVSFGSVLSQDAKPVEKEGKDKIEKVKKEGERKGKKEMDEKKSKLDGKDKKKEDGDKDDDDVSS